MGKHKIKAGDLVLFQYKTGDLVLFQYKIGWIIKIEDEFSYWVEYIDGSRTWYAPDTIKYLRSCLLERYKRKK